jgi:hypothetical protein
VKDWIMKLTKMTPGQMLVLGTLIRIALSPFFRHPYDVPIWKFLGMISYDLSVNPLPYTSFYGPCWLFTLLGSYPLYLIVSLVRPSDLFLNFVIKLPIIMGDALVALLLFKITKSKLAMALWFLNPYVIFISAIHGQFDVLPALFILLSMFFLTKKQNLACAVSLAVSIGYKIFPVVLVPFFLIFFLRTSGKKITLKYTLVLLMAASLLFAPFFLPQNFKYLYEGITALPQRGISYVGSSVSYIEFLTLDLGLFGNYNFLYLFLPFYGVLILWSTKLVKDFDALNKVIVVAVLLLFATYNTMHPQFLVWVIPFLLIEYERKKEISLSLINAMWVWMFLWIFSWNMQSWVVGPLKAFIPIDPSSGNNQLKLVFSMNFSAYTLACLGDVAGLLHRIRVPLSKRVRLLLLSAATFAMDILLYAYYGNFGLIIPILCFAVFFPLIIISFGGKKS